MRIGFEFGRKRRQRRVAGARCAELIAAARRPGLYRNFGVPDSFDGRFDILALYFALYLTPLERLGEDGMRMSGLVQEELFANLDQSLREMGVGDLSVGKKIKTLAEAFMGRRQGYDAALEEGRQALEAAIGRNIFRGGDVEQAALVAFAEMARAQRRRFAEASDSQLLEGPLPILPVGQS